MKDTGSVCPVCGEDIPSGSKYKAKKYCSDECRLFAADLRQTESNLTISQAYRLRKKEKQLSKAERAAANWDKIMSNTDEYGHYRPASSAPSKPKPNENVEMFGYQKCVLPDCLNPARSSRPNSACCDAHRRKFWLLSHPDKAVEKHSYEPIPCKYCGTEFMPKSANSNCCGSKLCLRKRKDSYAKIEPRKTDDLRGLDGKYHINCAHCGDALIVTHYNVRYCKKAECRVAQRAEINKNRLERAQRVAFGRDLLPGETIAQAQNYRKATESMRFEALVIAAGREDYNPRNPDPYVARVLAEMGAR